MSRWLLAGWTLHVRFVPGLAWSPIKEGKHFVAEQIGTMNGRFLNGQKLANGVLTPVKDGDELVLCRLALTFKTPAAR